MDTIKKLKEYQEMYKNSFEGKLFIFCSDNNKVYVEFKKYNFLHLTGIETHLKAKQFYIMLEKNKLSPKHIRFRKDGTTKQKLSVIGEMPSILKKSQITNDSSMVFNIELDSLVKTNKCVLAIGVHNRYPKTLLNIKTTQYNFKNFENVKSIEIYCLSSKELIEIINL